MQFDLITTDLAQQIIGQAKLKLIIKELELEKAIHHRLAIDIYAQRDLPPYNRVMMDGIALPRDNFAQLQKSGLVLKSAHCAGEPAPDSLLKPNEAFEVMTGSICPKDCDLIIPYEQIYLKDGSAYLNVDASSLDSVCCSHESTQSRYIHRQASDYKQGDLLLSKGTFIHSTHIAILASEGYAKVPVVSSPSICLISTGDELVDIKTCNKELMPHQIRRSNQSMLKSLLIRLLPQSSIYSLHLADDAQVIQEQLEQQLQQCDIILITGGISKGKKDWIRSCLEILIGAPDFHGIAQRPGKPLAFWSPQHNSHQTAVLALPGNPVSVVTCFHEYALSLLKDYLPTQTSQTPIYATLAKDFVFSPALTCFLPVALHDDCTSCEYQVDPQSVHNSGDFASLSRSTGYIELPQNLSTFPKGMLVKYRPWL